jgi:putative DNA-invertase from lambdoid prophage Rac
MRGGALIRVSTDEQELENQRAPLLELAAARGWELQWYEEHGVSGAAKRRPVLEQLLEDARRRHIRAVCVVALDRLGRSMGGVIATVLELDRLGCKVVSLREPWLDMEGPTRSLLLAIFAWVAEQERAILVDRTKAGLRRARERGTRSGKAIGRPRANQLLLGAAARYRQEGLSLREAARKAGVKPTSLRRHMARLAAAAAPGNDEGGPASTFGAA